MRSERVVRPRESVLIASGGGIASVATMAVLARARDELGLSRVGVVAVDDGTLEGSDNCADAARAARSLGLDVWVVEAEGRSVVRAGLDLVAADGWSRLAMGHTREDAAARVLREILQGRPLRGLVRRRNDGVIRPLLWCDMPSADRLIWACGIESPVLLADRQALGSTRFDRAIREQLLPRLRAHLPSVDALLASLPAMSACK